MRSTGSNPNSCLLSYLMVATQKRAQLVFCIFLQEEKVEFGKEPLQPSHLPLLGCRTHILNTVKDKKARTDAQRGPSIQHVSHVPRTVFAHLLLFGSFINISITVPVRTSWTPLDTRTSTFLPSRGKDSHSRSRRYRRHTQGHPQSYHLGTLCASATVWFPDRAISVSLKEAKPPCLARRVASPPEEDEAQIHGYCP